ncbi:MAG: hypothetical protein VW419_08085, partial [Paracoccaceae bacterium]
NTDANTAAAMRICKRAGITHAARSYTTLNHTRVISNYSLIWITCSRSAGRASVATYRAWKPEDMIAPFELMAGLSIQGILV